MPDEFVADDDRVYWSITTRLDWHNGRLKQLLWLNYCWLFGHKLATTYNYVGEVATINCTRPCETRFVSREEY